jgi:Ca2+-binding EF-hand superfamily protein
MGMIDRAEIIQEITHAIYQKLMTKKHDMKSAFEECDLDKDGFISHSEFVTRTT